MITVGITALPNPKEGGYKVSLSDLDGEGAGRSGTGVLVRDRIRAGVYKIEVTWIVTKAQLKTITDAIATASFSVTFFDPTTNSDPTKTMYTGDRSASLISYVSEASPANSTWELSLSLIEF